MKNQEAKILSGIAGEYFVAGELSRRGYIASITLKNTAHIDVLASNGKKAVNIQVKTRCIERAKGWDLGDKPLEYKEFSNNIFYVLVESHLDPNNKEIGYYVIPKNKLNKQIEEKFLLWKSKNKSNGDPKKSERRMFEIKDHLEFNFEKYKDNWNQLFI
ncbi:MAG: hypothetical protein ABIG99_01180 [Patescibacteria group bacterium]